MDRRFWLVIVGLAAFSYQSLSRPSPSRADGDARPLPGAVGGNPRGEQGGDVEDEPNLAREERHGGHLIRKHVGQSVEQLRARLERESNVSAASSFRDLATAEGAVSETLHAERDRIQRWLGGGEPRLALTHGLNRDLGLTLRRGEREARPARSVRLVLVRDRGESGGYRLLTGYPVP